MSSNGCQRQTDSVSRTCHEDSVESCSTGSISLYYLPKREMAWTMPRLKLPSSRSKREALANRPQFKIRRKPWIELNRAYSRPNPRKNEIITLQTAGTATATLSPLEYHHDDPDIPTSVLLLLSFMMSILMSPDQTSAPAPGPSPRPSPGPSPAPSAATASPTVETAGPSPGPSPEPSPAPTQLNRTILTKAPDLSIWRWKLFIVPEKGSDTIGRHPHHYQPRHLPTRCRHRTSTCTCGRDFTDTMSLHPKCIHGEVIMTVLDGRILRSVLFVWMIVKICFVEICLCVVERFISVDGEKVGTVIPGCWDEAPPRLDPIPINQVTRTWCAYCIFFQCSANDVGKKLSQRRSS